MPEKPLNVPGPTKLIGNITTFTTAPPTTTAPAKKNIWEGVPVGIKSSSSSVDATVDSNEGRFDAKSLETASTWATDWFLKPARKANEVREVARKLDGANMDNKDGGDRKQK
ncbi:hypothetical protein IAQ61_007515 [Plenodomus lingam]|uniref:Predicted protein n=1 Tax=Leptosphaeria maculans (strain JN3 / isolate v23.1.3 / race Av1-4-5-6-7-8) TaxID=985895 RepID=E5A5H3_LEPMJ|nr:predicted protein [Plenodomus lingam JN3]KAH9866926.1 hypothetical protein IAQ61_007515 [Plenodomus lingam]CBX98871.1 predicted protein [Plenodomus lingam JN3]